MAHRNDLANVAAHAAIAAAMACAATGDTLDVPAEYPTIQAAVDAATNGDTILVAPGVYAEQVVVLELDITIRSSGGPTVTTLEGTGDGTGLRAADVFNGFTLDGFTVRQFNRGLNIPSGHDIVIRNCMVAQCANVGARLSDAINPGNVLVENCAMSDNGGAGLSFAGDTNRLDLRDSVFERNAEGGVRLGGATGGDPGAVVERCIFRDNSASRGGGLDADNCWLVMADCIFEDNFASTDGGALYWQDYSTSILRCRFTGNTAGLAGGAIAARNSIFADKSNFLVDSLVRGNDAPYGRQIALLTGWEGLTDFLDVDCSVVEGGLLDVYSTPEWVVVWSDTSNLQDVAVGFGTLISGEILDLCGSDDERVQVRSQFGFTAMEPNIVDLRVGAISPVESPSLIDLTVEGHINQPGGSARLRLRNWATGFFNRVHNYNVGVPETIQEVLGIDAATFVRPSDGRIEVSVFQSVLATFSAQGFDSFTDWVEVVTR